MMSRLLLLVTTALFLSGCTEEASESKPTIRPVRTIIVTHAPTDQTVSLTGAIQAQEQVNLAFRIGGRMIERTASVGARIEPGQVVARLESQDAENNLRTAEADLAAAQSSLTTAESAEARQKDLLDKGVATRATYEQALQQLEAAKSQFKSADARLKAARDNLGYTELSADVAGVVIATGAEPGEVVTGGQMILRLAGGDAKDAVFNVPAAALRKEPQKMTITVSLSSDPNVVASGNVREVSPQANASTGTHLVKIGLVDPPAAMTLGATVIGSATLDPEPVIQVPGTALMEADGNPAVWVVDPATMTVALRPITVARHDARMAIVAEGLADGDIVVTAGVQALRPGQEVKLLEAASGPAS
jgi:RND family efflux transporter MFP subunit